MQYWAFACQQPERGRENVSRGDDTCCCCGSVRSKVKVSPDRERSSLFNNEREREKARHLIGRKHVKSVCVLLKGANKILMYSYHRTATTGHPLSRTRNLCNSRILVGTPVGRRHIRSLNAASRSHSVRGDDSHARNGGLRGREKYHSKLIIGLALNIIPLSTLLFLHFECTCTT